MCVRASRCDNSPLTSKFLVTPLRKFVSGCCYMLISIPIYKYTISIPVSCLDNLNLNLKMDFLEWGFFFKYCLIPSGIRCYRFCSYRGFGCCVVLLHTFCSYLFTASLHPTLCLTFKQKQGFGLLNSCFCAGDISRRNICRRARKVLSWNDRKSCVTLSFVYGSEWGLFTHILSFSVPRK